MGFMMTVDQTLIRAPLARIERNTPFYTGTVDPTCMKKFLFDMTIGNKLRTRKPNDPNLKWGVVAAKAAAAQARNREDLKLKKGKEITSRISV